MKHFVFFTSLLIALALNPFRSYSQPGSLDLSFDGDGIALFTPGAQHDNAWDMKTLPDTSILICGTAKIGTASSPTCGILMRVLNNGSQDMTWGTGGIVQLQYGQNTYAYNLEIQPDGKILVSGITYKTASNSEFFVARFNSNGTPDFSFNNSGYFTTAYSTDEEECQAMALQPDGKIVLAGQTSLGTFSQLLFVRVKSDGTIDSNFAVNGYREINASTQDEVINSVGFLSNGTIVGFGYGYQSNPWWGEKVFMAKLTPSGNPMPGFGNNGVNVPNIFSDISSANQITITDDKIFATGYMYDAANNWQIFMTRLDSSGTADPSFGTAGITFTGPYPLSAGNDIMVAPDNKVYVCGTTGMGGAGARDFILLRYLPNGMPDLAFNTIGYVITNIRPDWDEAAALGMQVDGKIVLTGMSSGLTTSGNNDLPVVRYLNDYIPAGCYANFSASTRTVCVGGSIDFSDLSVIVNSTPTSWQWLFPGGIPATSTQQNPTVTYNTSGLYDVQLIVSDGIYSDTLLLPDYISVITAPGQAGTPLGPITAYNNLTSTYITMGVTNATQYFWTLIPANAGIILVQNDTVIIDWTNTFTGTVTLSVHALNSCGAGPESNPLQITVSFFTGIENSSEGTIAFYPNPARENITIELPGYFQDKTAELHLHNNIGTRVKTISLPPAMLTHCINLEDLPAGIYFLTAISGNTERLKQKFIVIR